jgi:hypothetical protein
MSNVIIEEERGTYTGHRHPNNGYYAFTGQTARTSGPRHLPITYRPNLSGQLAPVSEPGPA